MPIGGREYVCKSTEYDIDLSGCTVSFKYTWNYFKRQGRNGLRIQVLLIQEIFRIQASTWILLYIQNHFEILESSNDLDFQIFCSKCYSHSDFKTLAMSQFIINAFPKNV